MKKKNNFLDPISEENKSKVFRRDLAESISSEDNSRYNEVAESPEYVEAYRKLAERVMPAIDVRDPSTFAIYGSAERYYEDSFSYIYNSYPYDGSALEKINWSLSASAVDLAILQHEYPFETGHVTITGDSGWGSVADTSGIYGLSDSPEYIKFSGGPYVGTVYDSDTNRGSSLKIDPSAGNTVEFWLKKNSFMGSISRSEVVFDSHTLDFAEGTEKYGRFLLELSASSAGSPFYITYMSGTAGANRQRIGSDITADDVADGTFHHYALAAHHTGSSLRLEFYVDGKHNQTVDVAAANFGPVSGYFNASIGALRTTKGGDGGLGYGKLSGSIDEFRFWKERRTAEDVNNYYDFPVNGATDDEPIDSVLGVYYKFNEGTVNDDTKDKVVLDYSGRLNNGELIGYNASTRVSTSAITLSSETSQVELGDPVINERSSRVTTSLAEFREIGQAYDKINHTSLMKSVPQWAYDNSAGSSNVDSDFSILLQAIGQKFDSIRMMIDGIPKIGFARYKDFVYAQGSVAYQDNFYNVLGCEKEFSFDFKEMFKEESFSVQNLLGRGFTVEESPISNKATLNEYFYNLKFDVADSKTNLVQAFAHSKVEDLKNKILNTIHVNISNIFKTKGTSQSFRNLIRCFGVDDNLVAPNVYGQNVERIVTNEPVFESVPIKSLSFTGSNNSMTLHQTASNTASDERSYIEPKTSQLSMTLESRTLFPHILDLSKTNVTASVFGMNSVAGANLVVSNPNRAGIVVNTIKSNISNTGCYFSLTSSAGLFTELRSPYFNEVYTNTPWYLAVKFSEDTETPLLDSDVRSGPSYKVEFIGHRYDLDVLTSTFHISASIGQSSYLPFMGSNKSFFLGADRVQLTGTVVNTTDVKALSFNVWDDGLGTDEMKEHAKSIENLGRDKPFFRKEDNQGGSRTRAESLVLNWQFDDVVYLDSSTDYFYDHSSGSISKVASHGPIAGYKYPAITLGLQVQSGSIQQEFIPSIKYVNPDNLVSRSKVEVKDREIEVFQLDSRPVSYLYSFEKSMYQVISKEMLNMLAGAAAFNNLIGEPVYKYRLEYKSLEKLRDQFFAKVENNIDLERFIEYYKWIDSSLGLMLQQLQPATSDMNLGLEDVVESHAFERNKYRHQPPQLEYKDPNLVGQILGINELLYDWEHGHAPVGVTRATATLMSDTGTLSTTNLVLTNADGTTHTITAAALGGGNPSTATQVNTDLIGNANDTATQLKVSLDAAAAAGNIKMLVSAVTNNSDGAPRVITLTQTFPGISGNKVIGGTMVSGNKLIVNNTTAGGSHGNLTFENGTGDEEAVNCLWWQDRAERDDALFVSTETNRDREALRERRNTVVSGSTYVLRKLARPYHLEANHQRLLNAGSNRKANKNKVLYRSIINSGQEIQINKSDIFDFKQCDDVLNPQEEKIYTAKSDTTGTSGYLDADADMIFPLSLYSSSVGTDLSNFKDKLTITNNHDDDIPALQGPFVAEHVGGLPHRRVKLTTLEGERPEAYILSGSPTTLTLKQQLISGPKSITPRGLGMQSVYNVANIPNNNASSSAAGPLQLGNFDKRYEIVLTSGRSLNNVYLVESGSIDTSGSLSAVQGMIDYTSPVRGRAEHVIVNKFSSPGGPETQGVYGRDKESGEFSIYNTLNYRNLSIRNPLNKLSAEHSAQFGLRSGSVPKSGTDYDITSSIPSSVPESQKPAVAVSVHMTNRNHFYLTNSSGQVSVADNHFVQHAIPQNDFGYSWIPAAANISKFEFVARNGGFGHQHNLGSTASVAFDATPARATLIFTAADAVTAGRELALTASDGTSANFNAINGTVTASHGFNVNPGGGSNPGFIAAQSLDSFIDRQYGFTSDLFGKIDSELNIVSTDNVQVLLTQLVAGKAGNTPIDHNLDNVTIPSAFTGGKDAGFADYKSESSIEFLSASILGSYYEKNSAGGPTYEGHVFGLEASMGFPEGPYQYTRFIPVDFVGLNTIIAEPVNEDTNTLGAPLTFTDLDTDVSGIIHGSASLVNNTFVAGKEILDPSYAAFGKEPSTTKFGLAGVLNSIVLNRQGPSGWPTWKQVRGGNHPVIRAHKKNNTFSRVFMGNPDVGVSSIEKSKNTPSMNSTAKAFQYSKYSPHGDPNELIRALESNMLTALGKSRMIKNYKDVVATNRFSPIRIVYHMTEGAATGAHIPLAPESDPRLPQYFRLANAAIEEDGKPLSLMQRHRESNWFFDRAYYRSMGLNPSKIVSLSQTFQNDRTSFANMEIADDTKYEERRSKYYIYPDPLSTAGKTLRSPGFLSFAGTVLRENAQGRRSSMEVSYTETIYPREINTFTENSRERTLFDYFPWDSDRDTRQLILTGNVAHDTGSTDSPLFVIPKLRAFTRHTPSDPKDQKKSFYGLYDIVNLGIEYSGSTILQVNSYITASTWPLDARKDFSAKPKDIGRSYFTLNMKYLTASSDSQGIRGEGILQNDFSTFPLGYNNVYGTPPFSTVYNRRMPQEYTTASYLSGEAKWQAADEVQGPFYDSYNEYCKDIKLVAPDHSLVPEFRMSEFVEDVLDGSRPYPEIGDDWLILTGAVYVNSAGDANVGGTFYKTYSNSDFLKYFQMYDENLVGAKEDPRNNLSHARINFRCKAAMKFLPYKGFYPADRAVEITELFHRHYLNSDVISRAAFVDQGASGLPREYSQRYGNLRANASKYQVTKPLFGPGILFNSVKAGVAVDYPIFSSSLSNAYSNLPAADALVDHSGLSISPASSFTGSTINGTVDGGVPRIKDVVKKRVEFEDLLSPGNLHRQDVFDNEPHPSASLLYGSDAWNRIIERPAVFGDFNNEDATARIGLNLNNTKEAFIRQLSPYTLAMQNFAAETVNFFVKDGHLTTAISKPIKERFVKDTVYKMRVRLTNVDTSMYDRHSAFGPPVDDGGNGVTLTKFTAGGTGTAAELEFTNADWESLNAGAGTAFKAINVEDSNNILPRIDFTGSGGGSGSITFYYSSTYSPKSATASSGDFVAKKNNIYIDLDGSTSGAAVAAKIEEHWNASSSANPGWGLSITTKNATTSSFTSDVIGQQTNIDWVFNSWKRSSTSYNFESVFVSGSPGSLNFSAGTDPGSVWTSANETSALEHGFMPYVPPFLDPGADPYVEISFTPSETKEFGAKEIIENCEFEYYNFKEAPSNAANNTNYINSMSLSASLNLGILAQLRTDNVETIAGEAPVDKDPKLKAKDNARFDIDANSKLSRWVIQTKWETPVLDFLKVTGSALDLSTESVVEVSGSPWKTKYWDSYYERGRVQAGATSGTFLTSSTGMWHQKGETISNQDSRGYFLKIEDVPTADGQPGLADKLGFNEDTEESPAALKRAKKYRARIGAIENRKLVKEAIVAIPYVVREEKDNAVEFIKFNKDMYENAQKTVDSIKYEIQNKPLTDEIRTIDEYRRFLKEMDSKTKTYQFDSPVNAIEYQLFMMEEYILPPQLDFLRNSNEFENGGVSAEDGFMMYFFQFHASFDADDVANIWQNLYPKSANSTGGARYSYTNKRLPGRIRPHGDISYTSHYLETLDLVGMDLCPAENPRDLFNPNNPKNKTRWLVFKVKQRGLSNLEAVRRASLDPRSANIEKFEYLSTAKSSFDRNTIPEDLPGRQEDGNMNLQFNWPYDYFSFVELIKLETKIDSFNYAKGE